MSPNDRVSTVDRSAIRTLYAGRGIVPVGRSSGFCCKHLSQCIKKELEDFWKGLWPYVGPHYGRAIIAGNPAGLLFVAMDQGGRKRLNSFEGEQAAFRKGAERPDNFHMASVSEMIKLLVDDKAPKHYSLQFALTNAVKCAIDSSDSTSRSTETMIKNCACHLAEEIAQLRPDLVVTQGGHPRATVVNLLNLGHQQPERFPGNRGCCDLYRATYRNRELVILTTPHPAHHPGFGWNPPRLPPYVRNALIRAREEVITLIKQRGI